MSETVGIRELRQQASALLHRVARGEVISVTDRGRPVARIVPLSGTALQQLVLEGRATEAEGDLVSLAAELDLPASGAGTMLPSEALADLRRHER